MRKFLKKNRKISGKVLDKLNGGGGIIREQFYLQKYFLKGEGFFMKMKKFFLVLIAAASCAYGFSQVIVNATNESDFDGKSAGIIDVSANGFEYSSYFKLAYYGKVPAEFDVYLKNPKTRKWELENSLNVKKAGTGVIVNPTGKFTSEMKKWSCAIVPKNGEECVYIPVSNGRDFTVAVHSAEGSPVVRSETNSDFDGKHVAVYDLASRNIKYNGAWTLDFYGNNSNDFEIYGKNPKTQQWQLFKSVTKNGFGSQEKIRVANDSNISIDMKTWTFAVVPVRDVEYQFFPYVQGNDLHLVVRAKNDDLTKQPEIKINLPNATILPIKNLEIEDYVKVVNETPQRGIEFDVYGFVVDKNGYRWENFGNVFFRNIGDTEELESDSFDLEDCRYVAINPLQDGKFNYTLSASHNDLYITVKNSAPVSANGTANSSDVNFVDE
jgi:hypothetical protein